MTTRASGDEAPVRAYRPRDRSRAVALLGDARAVDSPSHRLHVADDGSGVAVWSRPDAGGEAQLGAVATVADDRRLFYRLIAACARDALDEGFERAVFTVRDPRLLSRIERDFEVTAEPIAKDPRHGEAVLWEIHVDLRDALEQLQRVT